MNLKKLKRELTNKKIVKLLEFERKELAIKYTAVVEKTKKKYKIIENGIADTGAICNNFIEIKSFKLLENCIEQYMQVLERNNIKYKVNF